MTTLHEVLRTHLNLLEKWRKSMDLVGPGPILPHQIDAIGAVTALQATGHWADLGSGTGFPGIAFAFTHPNTTITLVESRQKRAAFLEKTIDETRLSNAKVFHGRVESLTDHQFDGIISRAYRPPLQVIEDADRLLKQGGQLVVMVGSGSAFTPPSGWTTREDHRYPVGDGFRRRLVLVRDR